jgi:hypothetical protein
MVFLGQFQRHFLSYDHPWTFPKTTTSKPNYFINFLISIFMCANVEKKSNVNNKFKIQFKNFMIKYLN